jgi:hypothetical protein
LKEYAELFVVKNYPTLLPQILQSNTPTSHKEALEYIRSIKNVLEEIGIKTKLDDSNNAFTFLHENTLLHPFHNSGVVVAIAGISGFGLGLHRAHEETLDGLIDFINQYCFDIYTNNKDKNFINGFRYEQKSNLNPSWLYTYCTQMQDEDFKAGREAARIKY